MSRHQVPTWRARKRHPLSWATENPLFAAGAVALVARLIVVAVVILRDYVGPQKHAVVEYYDLKGESVEGIASLRIERVTFQPGIDVRLSSFLRRRSPSLVIVDGTITNTGDTDLVAFFPVQGNQSGVVVSRSGGDELTSAVNTTGAGLCRNDLFRIPRVEAGKSRRFNVTFETSRDSTFQWMKDELRDGQLPPLSFGPFLSGGCDAIEDLQSGNAGWRVDFHSQELPPMELRDYYPFGAPTAGEFSLNQRRYWSDWLPRVN